MTDTDALVQSLFDKVQKKKSEIAKLEKPNWKTNCVFRFDRSLSSPNVVNINVCSDVDVLIDICAFLSILNAGQREAFEFLEIKKGTHKWHGYTIKDWSEDVKARLEKIQINKKKSELAALEERLDALVSPELKRKLELESIAKALENE